MRRECRERFPRHRLQRKPLVSDPGMHHGTCVTHVSCCMSGSFPTFPVHAQPAILRMWQEAHSIIKDIPVPCCLRFDVNCHTCERCPWHSSRTGDFVPSRYTQVLPPVCASSRLQRLKRGPGTQGNNGFNVGYETNERVWWPVNLHGLKVICLKENNLSPIMVPLLRWKQYTVVYHKVLFWVPYYSYYISMICQMYVKTLSLFYLLMIQTYS